MRTALRTHPELAGLAELRAAGWSFRAFPDADGEIAGLVGWRNGARCTDALWIFDRDECRAARIRGAGEAAGETLWGTAGDLETCVAALLALPAA